MKEKDNVLGRFGLAGDRSWRQIFLINLIDWYLVSIKELLRRIE
jgi:hypothetical protein